MERVLNTPELLELVLGALDTQTLLTSATRVCHYWNNLIQGSPELQRALFLWPETDATCPQPRANPLLSPHIANLSLAQPDPFEFCGLLNNKTYIVYTSHLLDKRDAYLRKQATWRQMLVQQPPVTKLGVWKIEFNRGDFEHIFEVIDIGTTRGLDMSQFVDLAKQWLKQGFNWSLFWGENGQSLLDKERKSLLVLKAGSSVQASLLEMRRSANIVVRLTRWH